MGHSKHAVLSDDATPLTKDYDYDDANSEHSSPEVETLRKPLDSFDTEDGTWYPEDLEDGLATRSSKGKGWSRWWKMSVREPRRKQSPVKPDDRDEFKEGFSNDHQGIFASICRRSTKRRRVSWYNYCIFGGISGLSVIAILLTINLSLGIATLIWSTYDFQGVLQNWGKPGTGTEDLAWYPTDFTRDIIPKRCHSHNDYWRHVPLFSALRAGCIGVEADVWLFDDDLYVGHNTASLTRNRTFTSLYVNPLVELLEHQNTKTEFYNGNGSHGVFDADPDQTLTLLIDLKTGGPETLPAVLAQLQPLRERGWLSFVENSTVHTRPITVVGTGNTPFDILTENSTCRDAFFDAPLDTMFEPPERSDDQTTMPDERFDAGEGNADDSLNSPVHIMEVGQGHEGIDANSTFSALNSYYASVSFKKAVGRIWSGRLSDKQIKIIQGQIRGAHKRGLKARYWGTPSWPLGLRNHVWDVLMREGADILNVDDLRAASRLAW